MKTAILIINWNDYSNTSECLNSIKKDVQNRDSTIVLIDNSSSDGSREQLVEEFDLQIFTPSIWTCGQGDVFLSDSSFSSYVSGNVCLKLNDNYGFTGANNFGMKFAYQSEFDRILWLNNDTIVPIGLIPEIQRTLELYPESLVSPGIVFYPDRQYIWFMGGYFDWIGRPRSFYYKKSLNVVSGERYQKSVLCSGCCMLYTRDTLKQLGGQDEQYFFNLDDADYSYSATKKGISTIVDTQTVLYHKSARSVSSRPGLAMYYYIRNIVYFRRKHFAWYQNILITLYLMVHICGVLIIFTLRGMRPYAFLMATIRDTFLGKMGRFEEKI